MIGSCEVSAAEADEGAEQRGVPKSKSFNAKRPEDSDTVEVQVKFVDYVPPPLRSSMRRQDNSASDEYFLQPEASSPVKAASEEEQKRNTIGEIFDGGSISEIRENSFS